MWRSLSTVTAPFTVNVPVNGGSVIGTGVGSVGVSGKFVLQPTVVYGPFGVTWTVRPLEQLQDGGLLLINGGTGVCNAVYVDDVVDAMVRASTAPSAHGEAFLISGADAAAARIWTLLASRCWNLRPVP